MYKFYTLLLILFGQMLWAAGFTSLQTGADARGAAMGFTGSVFSEGATALYWNPALLAESSATEAALSIDRWIQGVQTGAFAFSRFGFGLSLHYSQVGDIEHRIVPSELPIGTFSSTDAVIGVAFARPLSSRFFAGVKLNGYYEKIYLDEATGIGCDAGLAWVSPINHLRLAAVIQHLGLAGKLRKESLVLPLTFRSGAAYQTTGPGGLWTGAVELVQIKDADLHIHAGLEWTGYGLSLRAGYQSGYETRGVTAGLGFQREKIGISYGYVPFQSSLGDAHILTAVISW